MTQMLLLPDPRPLVERLGAEFFRNLPRSPGVYLMRDAEGRVLYVGKAKNLRNRLRSYRVANPDRMARRHLHLLRTAVEIEIRKCADEQSALAIESELLLRLRPRFNRAGTWPGTPCFLLWRVADGSIELSISGVSTKTCHSYGPLGAGAFFLRAALVRLLWPLVQGGEGLAGMPAGWFRGARGETVTIRCDSNFLPLLPEIEARFSSLFSGRAEEFLKWIRSHVPLREHPFESAIREADLESLSEFLKSKPAGHAGALGKTAKACKLISPEILSWHAHLSASTALRQSDIHPVAASGVDPVY